MPMKSISLYIVLLFALVGCGGGGSSSGGSEPKLDVDTQDTEAPLLTQLSLLGPTENSTPSFNFTSSEIGFLDITGQCSSLTTEAVEGQNTIVLEELDPGYYADCSLTVTDRQGNASTESIGPFTVVDITRTKTNTPFNNSYAKLYIFIR